MAKPRRDAFNKLLIPREEETTVHNRQGAWINFGSASNTVKLSTPCISTSAESLGHFTTVSSTGKIVAVETATTKPQTSQDVPVRETN